MKRSSLRLLGSLVVLSLFVLLGSSAYAQEGALTTGVLDQFASYYGEGFNTVNLGNLNAHFSIPIVNKSGRKLGFYYNLQYDSLVWVPIKSGSTTTWTPVKDYSGNTTWGWTLDTDAVGGMVAEATVGVQCGYYDGRDPEWYYAYNQNTFSYYDSTSTPHMFASYTGGCPSQTYNSSYGTYGTLVSGPQSSTTISNEAASDSSGYILNVPASGAITVTSRSGQVFTPPVNEVRAAGDGIKDPNSNQITFSTTGSFTDTTGNTVLTIAGSASAPPRTYTYPLVGNPNPSTPEVEVKYATTKIETAFGCSGIVEYGAAGNLTANLISEIDLPAGEGSYLFGYEHTPGKTGFYTGRIQTVTLPTGGVITYTYSTSSNCTAIQSDGSGYKLTRTTSDNHSTVYDRSTAGQTVVTATTGPSTQTVTTVKFTNFYETKRVVTNGSSTFRTLDTCYNGYPPPTGGDCTAESTSSSISEKTVYLTLDNSQESETDTKYGSYGEPLTVDEYDFRSGAPGPFLRETAYTYTYGTTVPVLLTDVSVWSGAGQTGTRLSEVAYGYSTDGKGNLTSVTNGRSSGPQLSSTITPNTYGMPSSTVDPSNHTTTYAYDSTNTFLTSTTLPMATAFNAPNTPHFQQTLGTQYDPYTGLLTSSTDQNENPTSYTYDSLWRTATVSNPDGGGVTYSYPPTTPTNIVQATQKINPTVSTTSQTLVDGFGRTISTGAYLGTSEGIRQDTCYDVAGRVLYVSSPYNDTSANLSGSPVCPSTTSPGDTYSYDTLGRVTQIQHVDGSKAQYSYTGRATQISEESNGAYSRQRIVQYDGIGRLTAACELLGTGDSTPLGSAGNPVSCAMDFTTANGYPTTYSNDLLGEVLSVTQPGVSTARQWTYDSLQRVTQEITPEARQINYIYAANGTNGAGQLSTLRRSVPNTTSGSSTIDKDFSYDELGRPYAINYYLTTGGTPAPNTPSILYLYDAAPGWGSATRNLLGNLTGIWTLMPGATVPSSGDAFDYDPMNRVLHNGQCTPNTCTAGFTSTPVLMTYAYNYAGTPTTFTNGKANITFSYGVDATGRLNQVTSSLTGTTYPGTLLSNVLYGPNGTVSDTLGNGVAETYGYGNPASGQVPYFNSVTAKLGATSIYSLSLGISGNGFVTSANDSVNGNWSYGYDSLDRVASASKTGTAMNWKYDLPGNRWQQNITTGSGPAPQYTFTGNNQISGATYDLMGNLLKDFAGTPHQYTYDAEGRVYQVDSGSTATYVYDGFGRRVKGPDYEYTFDLAGNPATLLNPTTDAVLSTQVYVGSRLLASYYNGGAYFPHVDHLGTLRARTDHTGTVCQTTTNLPFGDARTSAGTCYDSIKYAIGGYEYDSETILDKTQFRQYYSTPGRWMTPDPAGTEAADQNNPQSWNRYAYALNSPATLTDPLGLIVAVYYVWDGSCLWRVAGDDWSQVGCVPGGGFSLAGFTNLFGGSGGGGGGRGGHPANNGKSTCFPTSSLNWSQKAQLTAAQFYAGLTGWTFGFGAGLDAGAGIGPKGSSWNFGAGGSASTLIVADGAGNSGFLNSASGGFSAVKMSGAGSWWGAGAAAGPSVLVSPNPISTIAGPSGSFSAGGGAVLGAGISVTTSGAATVTFGVGAGAEAGVSPQFGTSQFIPFCHN